MSLIDKYRATLYTLFKGSISRILITNRYGFDLITNVFSQKEMLDMEILGVFILGDNNVFELIDEQKYGLYEIIFFIQGENDFELLSESLAHCKTNVFVHFYTPVSKLVSEKISLFDVENLIQTITSTPLAFLPVSDYVGVSDKTNIFPIMNKMPNEIKTHETKNTNNQLLLAEISSKLEECKNNCTLYERGNEETLLIVVPRSFDILSPLIVPWTYEALFRYLKLSLENNTGHSNDTFFSQNRFEYYANVLENIKIESNLIIKKYKKKNNNMTESFEMQEKKNIIDKHISLLKQIESSINDNDILTQSELEQRAILRDLDNKEKELFSMKYNVVSEAIFSTEKIQLDSKKSKYYQYVPKIKTIIDRVMSQKNNKYTNIYIYVKDYICYAEVAEVEKFNMRSLTKVYLLSDSILDRWSYIGSVNKEITKQTFRINKLVEKNQLSDAVKSHRAIENINPLETINKKVNNLINLTKNINIFDDCQEREFDKLYTDVINLLSSEYEKYKNPPSNMDQLEKNYRNIQLLKLENISSKFKNLEYKRKEDKLKIRSSLDDLFEEMEAGNLNDSNSQHLESKQYDKIMTEKLIDKRGEQIVNIRNNVTEIQSMYIDLHRELERQNLMLDQISVNLIKSEDLTKQGAKELTEANSYDKNTMSWKHKLIFVLIILNILIWTSVGIVFNMSKKHN